VYRVLIVGAGMTWELYFLINNNNNLKKKKKPCLISEIVGKIFQFQFVPRKINISIM
jgi:hypothetical protein